MKHFFEQKDTERPVLLLLHGTGGTERDLLPIANMIDSSASILGVRGNVLENGMPRFFKRLAEGVFDEADLIERTKELHEFLNQAAEEQGFDRKRIIAVGYSNGANIAASLLFHYPEALAGAVLFHPMVPRRGIDLPDMTGLPIFIGAGINDPICLSSETEELDQLLQNAGAAVEVFWSNQGHQLTREEVEHAEKWYQNRVEKWRLG